MSQYVDNVKAWARGWRRFADIPFQPGWSGKSPLWWFLYGINYGTRTLSGGACVSWSRWFHLTRDFYPASKFMDRALHWLDANHGADAGPPLWGTKDTAWAARGAVIFWIVAPPTVLWTAYVWVRRAVDWLVAWANL